MPTRSPRKRASQLRLAVRVRAAFGVGARSRLGRRRGVERRPDRRAMAVRARREQDRGRQASGNRCSLELHPVHSDPDSLVQDSIGGVQSVPAVCSHLTCMTAQIDCGCADAETRCGPSTLPATDGQSGISTGRRSSEWGRPCCTARATAWTTSSRVRIPPVVPPDPQRAGGLPASGPSGRPRRPEPRLRRRR